jgi:hypothetical protein
MGLRDTDRGPAWRQALSGALKHTSLDASASAGRQVGEIPRFGPGASLAEPFGMRWIPIACILLAACSSSNERGDSTTRDKPTHRDATDPVSPAPDGAPPGVSPAPAPPDQKYEALFVGRFDTSDPAGPKASWPGARVLARFEGTAVSVKLKEHADDWMEGKPSYWEFTIDKGPWQAIAMIPDDQPHTFELAKNLPPGPHAVEIYKRSETQTGITQFLGFDFHGGKSLPPPPRQKRKIEVMGDSFATGYGVENIDSPGTLCPGVNWGGIWQNFRKSWGAVLGVMFDAEVHGIVYSGKGLRNNAWAGDRDTLLDYYARADPNPQIANSNPPLFDLKSWIPDVIVMTQGSGDDGSAEFRATYRDFVINTLRARGPDTHIFMGIVSAGNRQGVADAAAGIIAERAAVGDHKMHRLDVKPFTWDEVTACMGHGTPAWQQRVANEIAVQIRAAVGWD